MWDDKHSSTDAGGTFELRHQPQPCQLRIIQRYLPGKRDPTEHNNTTSNKEEQASVVGEESQPRSVLSNASSQELTCERQELEFRRGDDGGRSWVHREGADLVAELLARDLDDFKLAQACLRQMREIRDLHGRQVSHVMVRARGTYRELQSQLY